MTCSCDFQKGLQKRDIQSSTFPFHVGSCAPLSA
jgi:hypothetical protein